MNIIEAIKSGKKFRRKGWSYFIDVEELESFYYRSVDILTDDWEVEEKKVTITAEELEIVFKAAIKNLTPFTSSFYNILKELKKELGL